jgi:hypothetical protein
MFAVLKLTLPSLSLDNILGTPELYLLKEEGWW